MRGPALRSEASAETLPWWQKAWSDLRQSFTPAKKRRAAEEWATNGKSMPEVAAALAGRTESAVRVDAADETIVSVAAPIQRAGGAIRGALLLSTQGGDIDSVIASERWALLRVFLVLATVMLVLSLLLAHTIAEPVRKLAEAAERVRRGIKIAPADPRLHRPLRRDRPSVGGAARHDPGALQPHRRDRELRRRRRPRAEEPADLAAQRGGDPAAGQIRPFARSSARHHAARRAPPRPADQRHLRRFAARRRARARRRRPGRSGRGRQSGGRDGRRIRRAATA